MKLYLFDGEKIVFLCASLGKSIEMWNAYPKNERRDCGKKTLRTAVDTNETIDCTARRGCRENATERERVETVWSKN